MRPDCNEPIELAWAAGYFDGEGNVGYYGGKGDGSYRSLRLAIGNTQLAELERFQRAVGGLGSITGPTQLPGRRPIWKWQIQNSDGARSVLSMLWPYLSDNKRRDAAQALEKYREVIEQRASLPFCTVGHGEEDRVLVQGRPRCRKCLSAQFN